MTTENAATCFTFESYKMWFIYVLDLEVCMDNMEQCNIKVEQLMNKTMGLILNLDHLRIMTVSLKNHLRKNMWLMIYVYGMYYSSYKQPHQSEGAGEDIRAHQIGYIFLLAVVNCFLI